MKITTRLVLDFDSGDILEQDCREYTGAVIECKGGGGGGTTTVQQADPWSGQQPFLTEGFRDFDRLRLTGGLRPFVPTTSVIPNPSQQTQRALALTEQRALAGSPLTGVGQQQLLSTMRGDYLSDSNPFLAQSLRAAAQPAIENFQQAVMPAIEARASGSGRFGSGALQNQRNNAMTALGRGLAEQSTQAYAQNYQQERQRQLQAGTLAPQYAQADYQDLERLARVGEFQDQLAESRLREQQDMQRLQQEAPYLAAQRFMAGIQGNFGGTTTQSSTGGGQRSNPLLSAAGGAIGGASLAAAFPKALGPYGIPLAIGGGLLGLFG